MNVLRADLTIVSRKRRREKTFQMDECLRDPVFDQHLLRVVLLLRVKEVKVTNTHIKLIGRRLLKMSRYANSDAQKLKFSNS